MARARTVEEAAWTHFQVYRINVWSDEALEGLPPFAELYVDRPAGEGRAVSAVRSMRETLLRAHGNTKVLLTGQRGAGKSWSLRSLEADEQVGARFEVVRVLISDEQGMVPQAMGVRTFLFLLARSVTRHMADRGFDQAKDWALPKETASRLKRWAKLFKDKAKVEPPKALDKLTVQLPIWLAKVSVSLLSERAVRDMAQKQIPIPELHSLVYDLVSLVDRAAERDLLLLVDDSDKLDPDSAEELFLRQAQTLSRIPARMVVTYPFALHFDARFNQLWSSVEPIALRNVKVVRREAPDEVLDDAVTFFRGLYERLADPAADLVDEEALAEAARLSAGIPREFLRLLQRGFLEAFYGGRNRLEIGDLEQASSQLQAEMSRQTQSEVIDRLIAIHRDKRLAAAEDYRLVNSLLVVELVNEQPWYDVHPVLRPYVERVAAQVGAG